MMDDSLKYTLEACSNASALKTSYSVANGSTKPIGSSGMVDTSPSPTVPIGFTPLPHKPLAPPPGTPPQNLAPPPSSSGNPPPPPPPPPDNQTIISNPLVFSGQPLYDSSLGQSTDSSTNTPATTMLTCPNYLPVFIGGVLGAAAGNFIIKKGDEATIGITAIGGVLGYIYATQYAQQIQNSSASPCFSWSPVLIGGALGTVIGVIADKKLKQGNKWAILLASIGLGAGYYYWMSTPVNTTTT